MPVAAALPPLDIVERVVEPPARRRHLIDPANPRPRATAEDKRRLEQVQRWVMSVLAVTTILHLSAGLVISAVFIDEDHLDARIALNVVAAAFGVVAIATGLAIHRRSLASPWLLLGLLPGLVGLYLVLR